MPSITGLSMTWPQPIGISTSAKASIAMRGGNEFLALDRHQEVEHVLIQHLPGADLLLDHVEARFLEVHQGLPAKY